MVHQSRTSDRDKLGNQKPLFKFILEWHAAVYDPTRRVAYEGNWNDFHAWIAREKGISEPEDSWSGIKNYVSADSFKLRALPQVKVLSIDTVFMLRPVDYGILTSLGYTLMGPDRGWLTLDLSGQKMFKTIPSAIT